MPTNDYGDLGSKSDEELLAMERDTSLPIDLWTAVEAERGRRQRGRSEAPPPATFSSSVPPAAPPPADVRLQRGLHELESILVPGERLLAYAVQRRLFALTHRRTIVGATTGRFVAITRGLFGGFTLFDVRWQDLHDAGIRVGIFGADLVVSSLATEDLATRESVGRIMGFRGLRKEQAQAVYRICQAQEQSWREKRRVRDLAELRAESGGVQIGSGFAGTGPASAAPSASGDPAERLRRAKEMLDSGLITDTEYESIKARVVDAL
jgi:hypothetical protein